MFYIFLFLPIINSIRNAFCTAANPSLKSLYNEGKFSELLTTKYNTSDNYDRYYRALAFNALKNHLAARNEINTISSDCKDNDIKVFRYEINLKIGNISMASQLLPLLEFDSQTGKVNC